jgi:radical SAM/Cys-rich protein
MDKMLTKYGFRDMLTLGDVSERPIQIDTLQVNITYLCNQACLHCHVDASPKRTEQMGEQTINKCLEILAEHSGITNLDLTGGAPELNPLFGYFVTEAIKLGKHVKVRHNLTVTLDKHPLTGASMEYLPAFFRDRHVEVISSLPYFQQYFTDKQRGRGVFGKSITSLKLLNDVGFGMKGSDLKLNLVYNPAGAFLPAPQEDLKAKYKEVLEKLYGVHFNDLFVIVNMPINRFKQDLERRGSLAKYMDKLVGAFNPVAAQDVMCKNIISVDYDGALYDCDFNQMLGWQIKNGHCSTIFDFDLDRLLNRQIEFGSHCYGCTAGAGSSCGGEIIQETT